MIRALALLLLSGAAMADPLMKETVPHSREAALLTAEEKQEVAKVRAANPKATVSLFRANLDALKAKEITVKLGGKPYRFVGVPAVQPGDTWRGAAGDARLEVGRSGPYVGGDIVAGGKGYKIGTAGRFQTLISR